MGRAFEFRRARKMRRWNRMAKAFTKLSKEITIAAKTGGPSPEGNMRLRIAMENARSVNMPKEKIEAAVRRATSKDGAAIQEVVYEGYGPHGIAIVVECATDNPTRTVGNVRSYFIRAGGTLGTTGSLDFLFQRKGVIRFPTAGIDAAEFELQLIDHGAEEITIEEGEMFVTTQFTDFVTVQRFLAEKGITGGSAEMQRIPVTTTELSDEQTEEVITLIEKLEEDEDVQAVYTNVR